MPRPFVLGLLIAIATAGVVVGVIAVELTVGSEYLWLLVPLVVLVCTIAVMTSQGTQSRPTQRGGQSAASH